MTDDNCAASHLVMVPHSHSMAELLHIQDKDIYTALWVSSCSIYRDTALWVGDQPNDKVNHNYFAIDLLFMEIMKNFQDKTVFQSVVYFAPQCSVGGLGGGGGGDNGSPHNAHRSSSPPPHLPPPAARIEM